MEHFLIRYYLEKHGFDLWELYKMFIFELSLDILEKREKNGLETITLEKLIIEAMNENEKSLGKNG